MRIEHLLMAVVVFGLVITVGFEILEDQDNGMDLSRFQTVKASAETNNQIADSTRQKVTGELDPDETTEDAMFKGGFSAIKDAGQAAVRVTNITTVVVEETSIIDSNIGTAFQYIVVILSTAFILYMVMRFKPQ